jgi:hypothetical protein
VEKSLFAVFGLASALMLSSCPGNGADPTPAPPPTAEHISYSIDGGSKVTYSNGPSLGGTKSFNGDAEKPFITIYGTTTTPNKLYLYASRNIVEFCPLSEEYIEIFLAGSGPFSGSSPIALITLQLPTKTYSATSTISLTLTQTVSSDSAGQTISGSFSGTVSSDGGTTTSTISGDFSLIYRNDSWTIS